MDKQYKVIDDRGRLTIPRSVRFLTGMDGNRRIGQSIYAGPILIVGDTGDEYFEPLTDEQADFYADKFKEIEDISEEEVQSDMYCTFIPLEMN